MLSLDFLTFWFRRQLISIYALHFDSRHYDILIEHEKMNKKELQKRFAWINI